MPYATFCKRTEDPKLAFIEHLLTKAGVPHRRNGESFHAPILEIDEDYFYLADFILCSPARDHGIPIRRGVTLDDVPDDHSFFASWSLSHPSNEEGSNEEADWYAELQRGYAQDRI